MGELLYRALSDQCVPPSPFWCRRQVPGGRHPSGGLFRPAAALAQLALLPYTEAEAAGMMM